MRKWGTVRRERSKEDGKYEEEAKVGGSRDAKGMKYRRKTLKVVDSSDEGRMNS